MRGKTAQIDWHDSAADLKQVYLQEKNAVIKGRLHLLWLVREGKQIKEAAALVCTHLRTARQWIAWYREGGLALVQAKKKGGPGSVARLNPSQQQAFSDWASEEGFATAQDACRFVLERFGVLYTPFGMYSLLRRLKIKKKVPRPMNAKADEATQEAYKKGA